MGSQRKIGAVLSLTSQITQIIINLVYTPIVLRILGQSEYGLYQLAASVVAYLNLLNWGFHSAYIRYYSKHHVANDYDAIASLNGIFLLLFCGLAVIALTIGSVLVRNASFFLGSNLSLEEVKIAKILMSIMVLNLALSFPNSLFDSFIASQEHFLYQKLLYIVHQLMNPIVSLPFLILGFGSVSIVAVTAAMTALFFFCNMIYCIKKLQMKFSFKRLQFSLFKDIGGFTFFIFINQIVNQLNWNIDKILLGQYIGTSAVAVYSVGASFHTIYMHLATSISNIATPRINALVASDVSSEKLTDLFTRIGRCLFFLLCLILIGFTALGKPFIRMWAGEDYHDAYYIVLLLLGPVTVPLIQSAGIEIQRAKNMHRMRSVVYLMIAIGNVLISIPLIQLCGGIGAAWGTAIATFLGNILFMNWYYHNRILIDMKHFWKEIFKVIPSMILPTAISVIIMIFARIENWLHLVFYVLVITSTYCVSVYCLGFNDYEKELVKSFLKRR